MRIMLSNVDGVLIGPEDKLDPFDKEILRGNAAWHDVDMESATQLPRLSYI